VYIREATEADNYNLIALQEKCPQGTTIVVLSVNTPDFFGRVKVYRDYKVFVACKDDRIIASAACALRDARIDSNIEKIAYEFQLFVDPGYRGRRIAGQLHEVREEYIRKQGATLSYGIIMEGNIPSIRHTERQGFQRYRTLVMPCISVFREMEVRADGEVRTILPGDLPAVAALINDTWRDYEFYEPLTAEDLDARIARVPGYSYDNLFVLEKGGELLACLGFWEWSSVMKVTVQALSRKMRVMNLVLDTVGLFRPVPVPPKPGSLLKQVVLTPLGFRETKHIAALLRHLNNRALKGGIEQIFLICERGHPVLDGLKGFTHIDTDMHLYVKPLKEGLILSGRPVFIDGLDL
jgi:GNAT superfamily N-acetyltransferase